MNTYRGSEWRRWDLHLHTASSYDSKYKGDDADELLCQTLHDNNISAVAITDHFKIDADRIDHLRQLAPDIVFFPGVELRTDKGANNLHLILIFSEKAEARILSEDFNVIMLREKAKQKDSDDTIYWTFDDIVNFAKNHDGLITIHAGKKANGIDKEIPNTLPVKEAIKEDIAENIHFFEVGNIKNIKEYYQFVFKDIEEKPIIMCSDNHDPRNYIVKENLWIKADLTFDGLKQCILQPQERVFVGTVPPALDRANKGGRVCIDNISVSKIENAKNREGIWFQFAMPMNTGLVAVIGNKGSGKSAFSDIVGQLCKCNTMQYASFLNENRFRKMPKNFANDYVATIKWKDGHEEKIRLSESSFDTTIEDAQYLPQKFIEEVCNDMDNVFQQEIDRVIFSYVDKTERGNATNLHELVEKLQAEKKENTKLLNGNENIDGLHKQLQDVKVDRENLIASANSEEKQYQKYLQDLSEWEAVRKEIIGDAETEDTLIYFKNEKEYIEQQLEDEYEKKRIYREGLLKQIFGFKEQLVEIYNGIYEPVAEEIKRLLGNWEDGVEFIAEVQRNEYNFSDTILSYISQRYAGIFKGKAESQIKMDQLIKKTEFGKKESILELVNEILKVIDEDIDNSEKKVTDKINFYNYLFSLDYIGVSFKLKMGGRDLEELSPGERGIVLLIFYLALSKNNTLIIIDQPEDNLDNQSVYSKLVPCICAAKQKRQVIIVTHNPNIAVACDAEQIVYCNMDKNKYSIVYEAGSIENPKIRKHVVDVLEGTMPAFDLRKKKYF